MSGLFLCVYPLYRQSLLKCPRSLYLGRCLARTDQRSVLAVLLLVELLCESPALPGLLQPGQSP